MSKLKISNTVSNNFKGWNEVLQKTLAVTSYRRFFEVTSKHNSTVVINNSDLYKSNKVGNCHENCRLAEKDGLGIRVSGWYVMNEFTHEYFANGMCRLTHHSNLLLSDGTLINITKDTKASHHIFIRDDSRDFDFENRIGYNDRMIFGDEFLVGKAVPRNKVHFANKSEFSRDVYFEKFKIYKKEEHHLIQIPSDLNYQEQIMWLTLKTNVSYE